MSRYRNSQDNDDAQVPSPVVAWRGVNNRMPVDKLATGLIADGQNVRMRNGDIEPRLGTVRLGWLNRTAPGVDNKVYPAGDVLRGVGVFRDPNSVEVVLTAADGAIFRSKPNNARFALPLPPGVLVASDCSLVQAFNKVFCFRGRHLAPLVLSDIDTGFEDVLPHWDSATQYKTDVTALEQLAEEIAYGPFQAVTTLTSVADLATVVTTQEHGYVTGADITIAGAAQAEYNGRWNITVIDVKTFTYQFPGSATATATGTIKCSNMAKYWKALGTRVTLTTLTTNGTVATATKTAHGFTTAQYVTITGATPAALNGTFQITVTDVDHFTYAFTINLGTATGTITAQTSIVKAGQSPDTNPEAWRQLFNILPNADDALFINNRLLVPTAFTPGADGYDASSSYTKKDYVVATDVLDEIHFDFLNEFRINQGDDSEIVAMVKYDNNTVIVCKESSWGILSNIAVDLGSVRLDMRPSNYGACALRSAIAAGLNVYFPATGRGIVGLNQTVQGLIQSVDVALSNDIDAWTKRITWTLAGKIRMAWWDDKLYVAVPIDGGSLGALTGVNNAVLVYDFRTREWVSLDTGPTLCVKEFFTAKYLGETRLFFIGEDGWVNLMEESPAGDQVEDAAAPNNLSFEEITTDFTLGGDLFGDPGPKQFPLVEFCLAVWNASFTVTAGTGRAHTTKTLIADKSFSRTAYRKPFDKAVWDATNFNDDILSPNRANYSVALQGPELIPAAATYDDEGRYILRGLHIGYTYTMTVQSPLLLCWNGFYGHDDVWHNTQSLNPVPGTPLAFTAQGIGGPYEPGDEPSALFLVADGPGPVQVSVKSTGISPGSTGLPTLLFQELYFRASTKTLSGQYPTYRFVNTQGRMKLKALSPVADAGQRRMGVIT